MKAFFRKIRYDLCVVLAFSAAIAATFLVPGCSSLSTNTFRTEQTAVDVAYTAYVGWTNYMAAYPVSVDTSNAVKQARLQFAASVGVVEALRAAYTTNSAVEPQLQAALSTLLSQSSNVVWLVTYLKGTK